jgi:hypothetical protein
VDLRLPAAARGAPDGALPGYVGARTAIGNDHAHIDAEQRWTLDQGQQLLAIGGSAVEAVAAKPVAMRGELAKGDEDDQVGEGRGHALLTYRSAPMSQGGEAPRCHLG